MVLIGKQEAFAKFRTDKSLSALITVLFETEGSIEVPERISQTEDAIIASLSSIHTRKSEGFRKAGEMLARRRICAESDWVHDDLLTFSIIVGNLCFGGSDKLVEELLRARLLGNDDDRSQKVTESLRSLASSLTESPILSVTIVGRNLVDQSCNFDGELLSKAYSQASTLEIDRSTNTFLRILGEKVADMALNVACLQNATEYSRLKHFLFGFEKRSLIFSLLVFWLLFFTVLSIWLYVAYLYLFADKASEELSGKLFQMGVVFAPLALLILRKKILKFTRAIFYIFFGARKMLLQDSFRYQTSAKDEL